MYAIGPQTTHVATANSTGTSAPGASHGAGREPAIDKFQIDRTLAALADPNRRRVIELLGRRPHRAGELVANSRLSAPSMSRHLQILKDSALVADEVSPDDLRVRIYLLTPAPLAYLMSWLGST